MYNLKNHFNIGKSPLPQNHGFLLMYGNLYEESLIFQVGGWTGASNPVKQTHTWNLKESLRMDGFYNDGIGDKIWIFNWEHGTKDLEQTWNEKCSP